MRTPRSIFLLLFLLVGKFVFSQGTVTTELGAFQSIKAFDGISITLIPAEENKAIVSGEDADDVVFVNKKGVLKIRMRFKKSFSGYNTFIQLHYKYPLEVIDVNENAKIYSEFPIRSNVNLELKAQEAGVLELEVDTQRLLVKSVSGGLVTTKGVSKTQEINTNTGGFYKGQACISEQAKVYCNTGAFAYVYASEYMSVKAKAGGTIYVYGNPKSLKKRTILGGRIIEN
ncbi:MAG: DUF2807 domain-containing protein [Flavobacteriaceae bacterium]|nr:DUF2807 domain-containing protein [Flavobacteriaceae bacterium]